MGAPHAEFHYYAVLLHLTEAMKIPAEEDCTRVLYIPDLPREVTRDLLHASFIPFGDILALSTTEAGGYVEYEELDDAIHAQQNMDASEMLGKVITVQYSDSMHDQSSGGAVWDTTDDYYNK